MKYKFGFDLGSTSLGWCVLGLDNDGNVISLEDMGVRIFPDGREDKTHVPLCVARRDARTARVRQDHLLKRKQSVLDLINSNNMSFKIIDNEFINIGDRRQNAWDPYYLRTKALDEKLSLNQIGRILFHLSLKRGYQSNRNDASDEDEKTNGKINTAIENLKKVMADKNYRTLGEFLYNEGISKFDIEYDKKSAKEGSIYPVRQMYKDEFEKIWNMQSKFYPEIMTDKLKDKFYEALFYQRPLKSQSLGFCELEGISESRAYKASFTFQKFRALQTLNQLVLKDGIEDKSLTDEDKEKIKSWMLNDFSLINKAEKLTFAEVRKQLGYKKYRFNLEDDKRKELPYDTTSFRIHDLSKKFDKNEVLQDFLSSKSDDDLRKKYDCIIKLEKGTGNLSEKAMNKIIPFLEEGDLYNIACEKAGYNHGKKEFGDYNELPYYGDIPLIQKSCVCDKNGIYKITNVSVHIAMNQLRLLVNELIKNYGKPMSITIEMARDLKVGTEGLKEINYIQARNKKDNDRIAEELKKAGLEVNKENILKWKLWENLSENPENRCCIYTGKTIGINELFSVCEIEHILPFSRTYDDSISNKTVSYVDANRFKGNRTPYEAFADSQDYNWEEIKRRVENLPMAIKKSVEWRFSKNAMEKFNKDNGPLARALNDTKYMAVMAVDYLKFICENKNNVYGLPGQMTALFREQWGLDWYKNKENSEMYRAHHMHHAIDAFVIACMTRGQLQKIATNSDKLEKSSSGSYRKLKEQRKALFEDIKLPFDNFKMSDLIEKCQKMVISYKPKLKNVKYKTNNQTIGALHEDTAYGLVGFTKGTKAIFKVKKDGENKKPEKDFTTLVPVFRNTKDRDDYFEAYKNWYIFEGQSPKDESKSDKKIREDKENELLEILQARAKNAYKWFVSGNNYKADVYQINPMDKKYSKNAGNWNFAIVSNYISTYFNDTALWRLKYPTARKIMTLKMNDMVKAEFNINDEKNPKGLDGLIDSEKTEIIFKVKKMSGSSIYFRPHFITKEDADQKCWQASVSGFINNKARKVYVTPVGKVIDPGFDNKWSDNGT